MINFFQHKLLTIGRLPSRRPIKSPRLEPPRYVNELSGQISETEESDFNSQETVTPKGQSIKIYWFKVSTIHTQKITQHAENLSTNAARL